MSLHAIGFVGPIKSGKSFAAHQLEKLLGLKYLSLSDEIRYEADKLGLPRDDRKTLQDLGDELRKTHGNGVLAERVGARIEENKIPMVVIDAIRNPGEITILRERISGIIIIGVNANQSVRYKRNIDSAGYISWKEFLLRDNREIKGDKESYQINIKGCLEMADILIINEKDDSDLLIENLGCALYELDEEKRRGKERF